MKKIRISAVTAGIIIATVAVAAQVIFGFSHPEAYGVCLVCHGRDMLAQLYQTVFHKAMDMAQPGDVFMIDAGIRPLRPGADCHRHTCGRVHRRSIQR